MDGTEAHDLYSAVEAMTKRQWVGRRNGHTKLGVRAWAEQSSVRILVVVANIQMRTLKAEEGKSSMWTTLTHGLVNPKRRGKPVWQRMMHELRKRIRLTFLKRDMMVDDNVRESGDVVEGLEKSYFFYLITRLTWKQHNQR